MILTKEKSFYRNFFSLWYVLVLNNVILLGVNLVDNIMLGNFSEAALSGATACNQIQFIFSQFILGVGGATVMLGSQYWGQKNCEKVKSVTLCALIVGMILSAIMFLLAAFFPEGILRIFTDSEPIIEEGVKYLRIIKYTYPVFALTNLLLPALRSVESVKIGFWVSVAALMVNVSLNYVLIFGHLGFPAMGTEGAAVATLIARGAELIVVLVYMAFSDKKLRFSLQDYRLFDGALFSRFLRSCLPVMITDGLFGFSTALQTVILGHMDAAAISANSVASTLFQVLKVAAVGSAGAASVIIGRSVGEGKREKTKEYARTLQVIFVGVGLLTSICLFLLKDPIIGMYQISDEAKRLADQFLLVLCVTCIGTSYQMPVNVGIVRGGGDAKFIMRLDLISIWGIVLPASFLAAFWLKWPPVWVIACLNADQIFKAVPGFIKVNFGHWMKKLTD